MPHERPAWLTWKLYALVAIILATLLLYVVRGVANAPPSLSKDDAATTTLSILATRAAAYVNKTRGNAPADLAELIAYNPPDAALPSAKRSDSWGSPISLEAAKDAKGAVRLSFRSPGPDKNAGTDDDFVTDMTFELLDGEFVETKKSVRRGK